MSVRKVKGGWAEYSKSGKRMGRYGTKGDAKKAGRRAAMFKSMRDRR